MRRILAASRSRIVVLVVLLLSKQLYVSSLSSYYIFYLIDRFGISTQAAQLYLFVFLAANAVGAFFGGPLGDRFGRKIVIWFSIVGALPFTLALPYVGLYASAVLTVFIGLIISSTTSSIIVFAQELVPHRFGMISGVFFGVAFGVGGLGAAALGKLADHTSIAFVYQICSFLPAIGLLAVFLPKMQSVRQARASAVGRTDRFRSLLAIRSSIHISLAIVAAVAFFWVRETSSDNFVREKSTLKIRVKRRLNIWCHRPGVSF